MAISKKYDFLVVAKKNPLVNNRQRFIHDVPEKMDVESSITHILDR